MMMMMMMTNHLFVILKAVQIEIKPRDRKKCFYCVCFTRLLRNNTKKKINLCNLSYLVISTLIYKKKLAVSYTHLYIHIYNFSSIAVHDLQKSHDCATWNKATTRYGAATSGLNLWMYFFRIFATKISRMEWLYLTVCFKW